jgi:hypothetical protein
MFGLAVAVVSILMRMAARFFIAGGFFPNIGADDICILVALVLIGGISGCAFIREHNHSIGMAGSSLTSQQLQTTVLEKISGPSRTAPSRHFYTFVQHGRASYWCRLTMALQIYYVNEILYIITLPLIKVSIICTYLRIFPEVSFRWLAFSAIGLNIAYVIAFLIVTVLQCQPISFAWNRWDLEHEGTCMDLNAQVMAAAAM